MDNWTKNQIVKFDLLNKKLNKLTIRIKTNGFVVFGMEAISKNIFIDEFIFVRGFSNDCIKDIMDKEYGSVIDNATEIKVIYPVNFYSLVPPSYFNEFDLSAYFLHAIPQRDKDLYDYHHTKVSLPDVICVNAAKKGFVAELKNIFPVSGLIAETQMLINSCVDNYNQNKQVRPNTLFLNFFEDKVDEILFMEDRLILMNRIEYHTIENFIYYVLNALSQSEQSTSSVDIVLLGEIQKQSSIVLTLAKYFDRIHFMNPNKVEILSETAHAFNLETNA